MKDGELGRILFFVTGHKLLQLKKKQPIRILGTQKLKTNIDEN